jgi:hypothetical protein
MQGGDIMKNTIPRISLLLFQILFFSGAGVLSKASASDIRFEYTGDWYGLTPPSPRKTTAKVTTASEDSLKRNGYLRIGYLVRSKTLKTCWGNKCDAFFCPTKLIQNDFSQEFAEKASFYGGDLIVWGQGKQEAELIYKEGKCLNSIRRMHYQDTPVYDSEGHVTGYRDTSVPYFECVAWEKIPGRACTMTSGGTVWRYDPELIQRLADKAKERTKIELEAKNELIRKQEIFISLKKAYETNIEVGKRLSAEEPKSTYVGGKYGFEDKNGKIIINPQFTDVIINAFSEDLACVAVLYKDKNGKTVKEPAYRLGPVTIPEQDKNIWGFIDKSGKWVIPPAYDHAGSFSEGLAAACIDKKYGYINKEGQFIIQPQFKGASEFKEGMAPILMDKKKWGYIDTTGTIVIQPQFDYAEGFSGERAIVKVKDKYGYIDKGGKMIIEPQFDEASGFAQGVAKIDMDKREGYIDKDGKIFMEP